MRDYLGRTTASGRRELNYMELAAGDRTRSGEQDIWEAVFHRLKKTGIRRASGDPNTPAGLSPQVGSFTGKTHFDLAHTFIQARLVSLANN